MGMQENTGPEEAGDRKRRATRKSATRSRFTPNDSDSARLDEIARILALGIRRLRAKDQQIGAFEADSEGRLGLDFIAEQSVHADS